MLSRPPHSKQLLDPSQLAGHDLEKILVIQPTAPIKSIRSTSTIIPIGNTYTPVLLFEGGTFPTVVTVRTGWLLSPIPVFLYQSRIEPLIPVGVVYPGMIPLDLQFADEITFIVRPGDRWWIVSPQNSNVPVTVIEYSMKLVDA